MRQRQKAFIFYLYEQSTWDNYAELNIFVHQVSAREDQGPKLEQH